MFQRIKNIGILVVTMLALTGAGFLTYFVYSTFIREDKFYVNTSGTAVVKEIQKLSRLETSAYTIEKIIDAGTQGGAFRQFLFGDRILLIANGQVIAGFDFSKISEQDIVIEGSKITMNAPAPQILFTRLDNQQTRVYDRTRGVLTRGEDTLETEARAQAEITIRDAACQAGILNSAEENGRKQLIGLFSALGFQEIVINIPKGSC
jgi:hypothetical protein